MLRPHRFYNHHVLLLSRWQMLGGLFSKIENAKIFFSVGTKKQVTRAGRRQQQEGLLAGGRVKNKGFDAIRPGAAAQTLKKKNGSCFYSL